MNNFVIKNVIKKVYNIDYSNINLENNTEMIISRKANDFHQLLFMNNENTNTYLIPYFETELKATQTGLFYRDQSFYNHPVYGDKLISFRLSLTGIKQFSYYRIRLRVSGLEDYIEGSTRKLYVVVNGKEIIINRELSPSKDITDVDFIYQSEASIINIAFTIGKVLIKDIIIDEVEVSNPVPFNQHLEVADLTNLKAYSVFKPSMLQNGGEPFIRFAILRGVGLNVVFDNSDKFIIVERNKENDVINDNLGSIKYMIDIKVLNEGKYHSLSIKDGKSPFSGTDGYYKFKLDELSDESLVYVLIYELL